jgi:LacI family transcriptional regulator
MPEENTSPVTVRDIAKVTGLHHTTVSLGLRNSRRLRPETLKVIQNAAASLGYSPDPMLSALNAYRQSKRRPKYRATLAWINNWPDPDALLKISTFRQYYEGACDRSRQLGYAVEEFWLHKEGMNRERMMGIFKARNIQGLLMAPQPNARTVSPLDCTNFSAVAFGYSIQPSVLNVVTNHHFHSMNLLLSKLLEMGYRRIGLIVREDWDERVESAWFGGLKLAHWKHPELVPIPPCGQTRGGRNVQQWMRKYKPDVVVSHDEIAQELKTLGYSIPEEVGFVSLDKEDPNDTVISGLNENGFFIGQKAVDVLVGLLHRSERGIPAIPIRLLVESGWVNGRTLRSQLPKSPAKRRPLFQLT